jgi:hypothetical protein
MKQHAAVRRAARGRPIIVAAVLLLTSVGALGAESVISGGTIAYALTALRWATYVRPDAPVPCPQGVNDGPREQFKALYPDDGQSRRLVDTQLKREIENWFPTTAPDRFQFREAGGPIADGLNLDGKVGPNDFTSPDGEPGIDNQLYRALGCINSYRDAHGTNDELNSLEIPKDAYNRLLIEISGISSLERSEHVEVNVYRGLDPLATGATGDIIAGGTQRIDTRWGARFIQHLHGKIVDGVLTTEASDLAFPWSVFNLPADEYLRGAMLRLKLTPTGAAGLIGGYADIETFYLQLMRSQSTHCQSYGQLASMSLYKELRKLADAYPDPRTGANTAISSALRARFVQVFIWPPSKSKLPATARSAQYIRYSGPPDRRSVSEEMSDYPERAIARGAPVLGAP